MHNSVEICGKNRHRHDLKGRMPERSEWLVAGGGAKRNPRRSTFQVGYHRDCRGNKKTEIITNIARINTALCKSVF